MYSASNQVHVATAELVTEPSRIFDLLSSYKIGYTFLPNFFLAAATKAFLAQETPPVLDLSQLSVIMTGGEANRTSTILAADEVLIAHGARPSTVKSAYGLSEVSCIHVELHSFSAIDYYMYNFQSTSNGPYRRRDPHTCL